MGLIKPVHGVPWTDGVVANCKWGGVRLSDVLTTMGVAPEPTMHVAFESHATLCQDDTYYGASIPLAKALEEEECVLLAYEVLMHHLMVRPEHSNTPIDEWRTTQSSPWWTSARHCPGIFGGSLGQMGGHNHPLIRRNPELLSAA